MSDCLAGIILAVSSSDEESGFWMQMLALVIVAGAVGVWSLIKTRASRLKAKEQYYPEGARSRYAQPGRKVKRLKGLKDKCLAVFSERAQARSVVEEPVLNFGARDTAKEQKQRDKSAKERDLAGGMELLEPGFLVSVVENTKSDGQDSVMMRKLSFNELARRQQLGAVDSKSLKVYVTDGGRLYGKDITCKAMKELAERTSPQSR